MNYFRILIFCLLYLLTVGCAGTNTKGSTKHESDGNGVVPQKFKISFLSYGTGIDYRQKTVLDSLVNLYAASCNIIYYKKNWGREGEIDYCFSQFDSDCEKNFYTDLTKNIVFKERVVLEKDKTCE